MKTNTCLLLAGLLLSPPAYSADLVIPELLIDGSTVRSAATAAVDAAKAGEEDCVFYEGEPHRRLWAWLPASQSEVDDLAVGPDGVLYLVRLKTADGIRTGKVILLK